MGDSSKSSRVDSKGDVMKIAVIGGGGREHSIIQSILKNPCVAGVYAIPGNGGISEDAICVDISDMEMVVEFCKHQRFDYCVVAPDDPLAMGMVDALEKIGLPCFGPNKLAAEIESSKVFAKNLMKKYHIPTATYESFEDFEKALEYIETVKFPTVIKADGLALGKGVIIAMTKQEAIEGITLMMQEKKFGESGAKIVIEEYLEGPEVSVLAFTDGKTIVPMISSMDHKRALDGDRGLNTGGMGTIAPNPYYTEEIAKVCMDTIFIPTMQAMNQEGRKFKGCLYFGLMLTKEGVKVIEYNCRFGDPETQVVLPLLETDLLEIMLAVTQERLGELKIQWSNQFACCVILASKGYPKEYKSGYPITGVKDCKRVYAAGVKIVDGVWKTAGGRVLGVTGVGATLKEAVDQAYMDARKIHFENMYMRSDIGKKALEVMGE